MAFCLRDLVELRQTDREGLGVCSQVLEVPARPARGGVARWNCGVQLYSIVLYFHFMLP